MNAGDFRSLIICITTLLLRGVIGGSLTVSIPPYKEECLSIERQGGEKLVLRGQVKYGYKFDFRLLNPRKKVLVSEKKRLTVEIQQTVAITGLYDACFSNGNTMTEAMAVTLEYDYHLDNSTKARIYRQISAEKNQLLRQKRVVSGDEDQQGDMKIKEQLLVISIKLEAVYHYLRRHSSHLTSQFHLQERNLKIISYISPALCLTVFLTAYLQIIILKRWFK